MKSCCLSGVGTSRAGASVYIANAQVLTKCYAFIMLSSPHKSFASVEVPSKFLLVIGLPDFSPVPFNLVLFCIFRFLQTRICLPKVHFLTNLSNATNEKICYWFGLV